MEIIYYRHNTNAFAPEIPLQTISFCELTIVLKGSLLYYVNGTKIRINENQCVFIEGGSKRQRVPTLERSDYISFNFIDPNIKISVKNDISSVSDIKLLLAYSDARFNAEDAKTFNELELVLKTILIRINKMQKENGNPIVAAIKNYISINPSRKLSLSDIADYCHYSVSRIAAVFKKETGRSIINYILDVRINKSKGLLAEGLISLEDIAYEVGFSDVNYFIRTFKKLTGSTPLQYRKTFVDSVVR